jgi:hypothetical protein
LLSLPIASPLSKTNSPASAGSSEDEAVFGETLKRIATAKPEKGGKSKG